MSQRWGPSIEREDVAVTTAIDALDLPPVPRIVSDDLKNDAKYAALRRLYAGLRMITLIVAAFLMLLVFLTFAGGQGPLS